MMIRPQAKIDTHTKTRKIFCTAPPSTSPQSTETVTMVRNANDIQPNHQPTCGLASREAHWEE